MLNDRYRPTADIGDGAPICHPATILRSLATPIKPNPPKDLPAPEIWRILHSQAGGAITETHAEDRMAMFKKADNDNRLDKASPPRIGQTQPIRSKNVYVIGPTLVFKGELSADEDLIIEGRIEGTIAHHKMNLTVGKQGRVKADIDATSVIIEGQLVGDIRSDGIVTLAKGADVRGNIYCGRIVMEDGARFEGKIDMGEPPKIEVPKEPVQAEPVRTEKPRKVAGQTAKASVY